MSGPGAGTALQQASNTAAAIPIIVEDCMYEVEGGGGGGGSSGGGSGEVDECGSLSSGEGGTLGKLPERYLFF